VRVSGCNLRCTWCDTPYASWKPEGPVVPVDEILREVKRRAVRHVVLTGGEPMLFDAIEPLASGLRSAGHVITVETAGTVFRELPCDLMSISPKLAHSTPSVETGWAERHEAQRLDFDVLKRLTLAYEHQLKFVVNPESGTDDLQEIRGILSAVGSVNADNVILMAEGRDALTLHRRERALVEVCLQEGWRLTPRYQIDLFGDTRGT
jgi:7-carboxy-7-deazaguanine synthase